MSSASRRSRTRDKSGILYAYEDGIRRISQRSSTDTIHRVDPDDARRLGVDVDTQFIRGLPELPVPASGQEKEDCGDPWPARFCERCGSPAWIGKLCERSICPRCWESWARNQATEITSKLKGRLSYEKAKLPKDRDLGIKAHHVTASVPHDFLMRRSDPLDAAFEIVKELLVEVGAFEGSIIYHPWRIAKEHRGDVLGHSSGSGEKTWADILGLIEKIGWPKVQEKYLVFAPHFHCIVLSRYVDGTITPAIEEQSGWVVHRIASDESGVSIGNLKDMASVAAYTLSHSGISETADGRMQAEYRYFGEVADFEPTDGVRRDAKAAVNAISEQVLGVRFGGGRCSESEQNVGNAGTGTGRDLPDHLDPDYCNGQFIEIDEAPEYLTDSDWIDGAPRSDELRSAWIYFLALGDRPPPPALPA